MKSPLLLFLTLCLIGCARPAESQKARQERTCQLTKALQGFPKKASKTETRRLAQVAIDECASLRLKYNIRLHHDLHNLQVYWGLKRRGFCWHWQEDLDSALAEVAHPTFEIRRICAYPGSIWMEHHALLIAPKGADWRDGLVLDPWRQEGLLWFGKLTADHYPWNEEPRDN